MAKRFLVILICAFFSASLFALDVQKDIIDRSRTYVGCAYSTGGTRPPEFDCSGFVGYIMRPFVPGLPRLSRDMADSGKPIAKDALEPGDLVFFATTQVPGAISHVALYIGGGSIIHAISDGPERGVRVTPLGARYWQTHFASAVRILPPSVAASSESAPVSPPAKPAPEPAASAPSPWDTWDGYIRGDYEQWKAQEQRKLEAQEKAYDKNKEKNDFDEWKKANGE